MAIITITRGVFSKGREVAEKVAERLGYHSISREVVQNTSDIFHIPREKLEQAFHDAPSIFQRFSLEKRKYITYVVAEVLDCFKKDKVVYHGLAGNLFLSDITHISEKILAYFKNGNVSYNGIAGRARRVSHLINVRLVVNWEDRIFEAMKKQDMTREQAQFFLKKEDNARKIWSRRFYGVDDTDLTLYDLVIHLDKLSVEDAVDIIIETVSRPKFIVTPHSQLALENMALSARIRSELWDEYPDCEVIAEGTAVEVFLRYTLHSDIRLTEKITAKVMRISGVSTVSVILIPSVLFT